MTSNVLPLNLKKTFLPMIWIFTEGEGDGIEVVEPRVPFKIFSTLVVCRAHAKEHKWEKTKTNSYVLE